jgi:hypothetical protein
MTIRTGDLLLEVTGEPRAPALRALSGVRDADVYPQARIGDATVHLTLEGTTNFQNLRQLLEENGVHVLACKRVA